ncbi:MAG: hypothetical protein NC122_09730 [Faecalibacterium sp.]|nr:hypothetical protein [Ruminococcus sp.]MCM1393130.1 hypothetical protein [Ruminococcus sp.]MCM1486470.1 hypothetical protein [Faecalibacterium sp.]
MIKEKVKYEFASLKKETTVIDIIFWWVVRVLLAYALIRNLNTADTLLYALNLLACFAISLLKLITPKKSFINRLDYRIQTILILTEFLGYYVGKYLNIYQYIPKFDLWLHFVSGPTVMIIGYYLFKAVLNGRSCPASIMTLCSAGFSGSVVGLWEVMEFFGDYFFGTHCQGFNWTLSEDFIMFRILGFTRAGEAQFPMFDTILDMIMAYVSLAVAMIIMFIVLRKKEKKLESVQNVEKITETCKG